MNIIGGIAIIVGLYIIDSGEEKIHIVKGSMIVIVGITLLVLKAILPGIDG